MTTEIKVKREETVDGKTLKRIELPQGGAWRFSRVPGINITSKFHISKLHNHR